METVLPYREYLFFHSRIKLKDDFDTVTKVVDWDLFTGFGDLKE